MSEEIDTNQKDQLSEKSGLQQVTPQYLPQATLQYRTFLKRSITEGLQNAFVQYDDETLEACKIGIDYQTSRINFPNIVVKYYEKSLQNAGVGHKEWGNNGQLTELIAEEVTINAAEAKLEKLASTEPLVAGETTVRGPGIPPETFVQEIIDGTSVFLSNHPERDVASATVRFKSYTSDKYTEYHHYRYNGDISLEIYGMSSADRDRVSDAVVEVVAMGTVGAEGRSFQERLYNTIEQASFPYSAWHFIVVNTDILTNYGETEELAPWMPEDVWLYKTEYRFPVQGEFYSITPLVPVADLALVKQVDVHPFHEERESGQPIDIIPVGVEDDVVHMKTPEEYPDEVIAPADYLHIKKKVRKVGQGKVKFEGLEAGCGFSASLVPRFIP